MYAVTRSPRTANLFLVNGYGHLVCTRNYRCLEEVDFSVEKFGSRRESVVDRQSPALWSPTLWSTEFWYPRLRSPGPRYHPTPHLTLPPFTLSIFTRSISKNENLKNPSPEAQNSGLICRRPKKLRAFNECLRAVAEDYSLTAFPVRRSFRPLTRVGLMGVNRGTCPPILIVKPRP